MYTTTHTTHSPMFTAYPDIVSIHQIMEMLSLGKSSVYALLRSNTIPHVRVGRKYIVPKQSVIHFLGSSCYNENQIINGRLNQQSVKVYR